MKDELMLLFEAHGKQYLFLSIKSKEFHLTLSNLVYIFEALNNLKLILHNKDINGINNYDAINAFMVKLGLVIIEYKKKMQLPFLN